MTFQQRALRRKIITAVSLLCVVLFLTSSWFIRDTGETETEVMVEPTATPIVHTIAASDILPTATPSATTEDTEYFTEQDADDLARLLSVECLSTQSTTEKACVVWCVLNRVDATGESIHDILRVPNQFAFDESVDVDEELRHLAYDVLYRWIREKNGEENVGRVLPQEYMYFYGDGEHNYFRNSYDGDYSIWDYSLESPYGDYDPP